MYRKPTAHIILNNERLNGNKVRVYTVATGIQHSTESSSQHNKAKNKKTKKGNKRGVYRGKKQIKLFLFQINMIVYVQNSKESTKTS